MNKVILPKQKAITIFLVFALGYYISNLLRAITATISPNLISEFNLSAGDLGLLGGGYFLGFAAVQIPLGYLLDNKGPKKIVSYFLLIAVLGMKKIIKIIQNMVNKAKVINITLHPIIGKKNCTGRLEESIPIAPTINIHEFALCCVSS